MSAELSGSSYRELLNALPGLYLILTPMFEIVGATDAYLAATMTTREGVLGRNLFEVFPDNPDDAAADGEHNLRASLERVRRELVADTMAVQKYDIRRPDSEGGGFEIRYWSPINTPVLDGSGELSLIVHRVEDVTEFVRLQEVQEEGQVVTSEYRERTIAMQSEIVQRSHELHLANTALRSAAGEKDQFLSRMSHELRTPLNAISGFAQLLNLEELTQGQRESVAQILKASTLLLALINEILDISRISSGQLSLSLEPVSAGEVVVEAIDLVTPMANGRSVSLQHHLSDEWLVTADRQRLKQVFLNLLTNAVKYNQAGGSVTIEASDIGSQRCRVAVTDTGVGIADDRLHRLFEPFDRLGAEQSEVDGTGLGLALTKGLVEAMGGQIGVTTTEGVGSTFYVDLARCESEAQPDGDDVRLKVVRRSPVRPSRDPLHQILLYIEDNLSNIRLVERIVDAYDGTDLISAMQGRRGLELAQQHQPALILLDYNLPDISGEDVLRELRADLSTKDIPVIVMSADATPSTIRRVFEAGANEYVSKPIDVENLFTMLDGLLLDDDVEQEG